MFREKRNFGTCEVTNSSVTANQLVYPHSEQALALLGAISVALRHSRSELDYQTGLSILG